MTSLHHIKPTSMRWCGCLGYEETRPGSEQRRPRAEDVSYALTGAHCSDPPATAMESVERRCIPLYTVVPPFLIHRRFTASSLAAAVEQAYASPQRRVWCSLRRLGAWACVLS